MITSRGCSYGQCKFCYQGGQYGSVYRRRSPEHVVDEVARLCRDYGIKEVIFSDDNFGINSKWIGTFCDLLDEEKLDITWTMQSRVNTVTKEMLHRMAASGCYNVYFGFESGSQYMLDLVKKGITLDQSRQAVKWANSAGMEIRGSFIMGMPTETREMAKATIKFACELNADWVMFYPYHVQAGTALAELAARNGVISEELENIHLPSYISSTYGTVEELSKTLRSAYIAYYLRPRYFARALWRARDPRVLRNNFEAFKFWLSLTFKSSH